MAEHVRRGVAYQIRALRDQRGWNQGVFSKELHKPQSVVCRLEDPSYGKATMQTLLEVANVCDVALQVRFVPYSLFLQNTRDVSSESMKVPSFEDELYKPAAISAQLIHMLPLKLLTTAAEKDPTKELIIINASKSIEARVTIQATTMKVHDHPEVYGYTIFCDDIRYERDGKINYIGCYGGTYFVHAPFPFTFPKLCFAISLLQRRESFDPNIEFRIFFPGDPDDTPSFAISMRETAEGIVAEQAAKQVEGLPASDQRVIAIHGRFAAAPAVIKEPGTIKVRAMRKGELIRLGGIRIVSHPGQAGQSDKSPSAPDTNPATT
jgi:hypothetical protein